MDRDVVVRLVSSMVQFLREQLTSSGTPSSSLTEEGAESVEVAIQCLETAYNISHESSEPNSLYNIFSESVIIEDLQRGHAFQNRSVNIDAQPAPEDIAEGDNLKNKGNDLMREEKFTEALDCYTRAISRDPTNAVFYCNRAAAHNKLNNHQEAIEDCKRALRIEPQYSKAYGRMGLAYSALDCSSDAFGCYKRATELEPDNESYKSNLSIAAEKMNSESQTEMASNPFAAMGGGGGGAGAGGFNLANLAGMMGGGGAVPPGATEGLQNVLSSPNLMNLASTLMSDPNMQNMMSTFLTNMGGAGGSAPPAGPAGPTAPPPGAPPAAPGAAEGAGSFEALLNAGRHLAEQMQAQNPELVEQLRSQMNRPPGSGPGPSGNPPDSQDPPPQT